MKQRGAVIGFKLLVVVEPHAQNIRLRGKSNSCLHALHDDSNTLNAVSLAPVVVQPSTSDLGFHRSSVVTKHAKDAGRRHFLAPDNTHRHRPSGKWL